jgi:hypothetical protein
MKLNRLSGKTLAAMAFGCLAWVSTATYAAADLNSVLQTGTNEVQDSDAERVLRTTSTSGGFTTGTSITSGGFLVGDVIQSILNFNTVNGSAFSSYWAAVGGTLPNGYELNGISELKIASIYDLTTSTPYNTPGTGPATLTDDLVLTFAAAGALTNNSLVDIYEGILDYNAGAAPATGLSGVAGGDLIVQLGLNGLDDFWTSSTINDIGVIAGATQGSGQQASGVFGLTALTNAGSVPIATNGILSPIDDLYHDVVGDASIYARETGVNDGWLVSSNINAAFNTSVPEPATLALLGLGVLGLGATTRRKKA